MESSKIKTITAVAFISLMSFEELLMSCPTNGPLFEPEKVTCTINTPNCVCCHGCIVNK